MSDFRVAVIGTGSDPTVRISGTTHSWGFRHGSAYRDLENCELVACADIEREHAENFAEEFDIPEDGIYEDHTELLAEVEPDIVSVCTPIPTHTEIVIDCARSGVVDAIHCEKPMARTWQECRLMAWECERRDVQLTFGHQRRFADPFVRTKELVDDGAIGDLDRIEVSWGNFFDNGTHTLDLCAMFNDERPADWVIGQIDYREEHIRYGVHHVNQAFMLWQYDNGVYGMAATGNTVSLTGSPYQAFGCVHRLRGTDGVIEVGLHEGPPLRVKRAGSGEWEVVDCGDDFSGDVADAVEDAVRSLETGDSSQLCGRNALKTTEILFAGHESARKRGRVDLPLTIDDHPLESMVESGDLEPASAEAEHQRRAEWRE